MIRSCPCQDTFLSILVRPSIARKKPLHTVKSKTTFVVIPEVNIVPSEGINRTLPGYIHGLWLIYCSVTSAHQNGTNDIRIVYK